jgi:putative transposase
VILGLDPGIQPKPSSPCVSDDNPYSESLFKTAKYHPSLPLLRKFESIEDAKVWMEQFATWYNKTHLHSALKFVTPHQRHVGEDKRILSKRHAVYEQAKLRHPERWSSKTRNWALPQSVTLNPDKKHKLADLQMKEAIKRVA